MTEPLDQGAFQPGQNASSPVPPARILERTQAGHKPGVSAPAWKTLLHDLPKYTPVTHREISGPVGLSFGQQRLWFVSQLGSGAGSTAYNVPLAWRLEGAVSLAALESGLSEIIRRHEALRTCFDDSQGEPVQVVMPARALPLTIIDLEAIPRSQQESELQLRIGAEVQRPFDLSRDLTLRAALFRLRADEHLLVLTVHHIASDGPSMGVLLQELAQFYSGFATGIAPDVPAPVVQCRDFTLWQKETLTEERRQKQLSYWLGQLRGVPSALDLPADHPRPTVSFRGGMTYDRLPSELSNGLKLLARQHGVTNFMVLLAAMQVLMYRLSGQDDVVVGAAMTNRTGEEIARSIGYFSNMMALRTGLHGDPGFHELLKRVRTVVLGAYAYPDLPFEEIVAELQPERSPGRNPVFQVIINVEHASWHELRLAGLQVTEVPVHNGAARFDLNLSIVDHSDGYRLALEYNSDLFEAETARQVLARFGTLLRGIVDDPTCPLSRLPLLTEEERKQAVSGACTVEVYPDDVCLHDLVEAQVERTPDSVAIEFEGERLTYRALNARANQLAGYLAKRGVGPEVLVGICLEPSPAMVVAMLGVLKAGGAYVPLDPSHPAQRREEILVESAARILLTQEKFVGEMSLPDSLTVIPVDTIWPLIARETNENPVRTVRPDNLVYVIHTSGSTGRPKGVQMEHRNLVNFLLAFQRCPGFSAEDVVLATTTITFDPSVVELLLPLTVGARIVIVRREDVMDAHRLRDVLQQSGATVLQATPTSWKLLLAAGWEKSPGLKALCGGEVLSRGLADQLLARCDSLWNIYGPTETTVWSFVHKVDPADHGNVPLGKPIPNVRMYVLDTYGQPAPRGVAGELFIGGPGVGRGYFGRDDLNARSFVPDPFSGEPGARMYRSGDLVRLRNDGSLEFVARADRQIKIRGNRIEPGEVESVLAEHPNVEQVAVVPREDGAGGHRLVAYLVPRSGRLDVEDTEEVAANDAAPCQPGCAQAPMPGLRSFSRRRLPEYMVPSAFVSLEELPRSPTGKLDWRALPEPEFKSAEDSYVAPRDLVEIRLARIWEETLKVSRVGATDDFFSLGGHSVLGAAMFTRIEKEFGRQLPMSVLFQAPTLERMASVIRQEHQASPWIVEVQPGDPSRTPFFFVEERMGYKHLGEELGAEQPVYVVLYQNLYRQQTERTMRDIAGELAAKVREVQPQGPYMLGGTCMAGWVSFSVASELIRQGEKVELLAIFDSFAPAFLKEKPSRTVRLLRFADHLKFHVNNLLHSNNQQRWWHVKDRLRTFRWHLYTKLWWWGHSLYIRTGKPLPRILRQPAYLTAKAALTAGPADPYPGRIALFRPIERPRGRYDDPYLGWLRISPSIEMFEVPGDHKHMLLQPAVRTIAEQLKACLQSTADEPDEEVRVIA